MAKQWISASVIILNSLFKQTKHIVSGLIPLASFTLAISCKSKKHTQASAVPAVKDANLPNDDLNQARIGFQYVDACLQRKKGNLPEALKRAAFGPLKSEQLEQEIIDKFSRYVSSPDQLIRVEERLSPLNTVTDYMELSVQYKVN